MNPETKPLSPTPRTDSLDSIVLNFSVAIRQIRQAESLSYGEKLIKAREQIKLACKEHARQLEREPTEQTKLVEDGYSRGVTAGKLEAAKYSPEERERYGKWVAAVETFATAWNLAITKAAEQCDMTEGYGAASPSEIQKSILNCKGSGELLTAPIGVASSECVRLLALRNEAVSALTCLYIATDERVAKDVNDKVMAYIAALESEKQPNVPN